MPQGLHQPSNLSQDGNIVAEVATMALPCNRRFLYAERPADGRFCCQFNNAEVSAILGICGMSTYRGATFPAVDKEGYAVSIVIFDDAYICRFGGLEQEFSDFEQAADWVRLSLTDRCRLKIESRGGVAFRWSFQQREQMEWSDVFSSGHLRLWRFWQELTVEYRYNGLPAAE